MPEFLRFALQIFYFANIAIGFFVVFFEKRSPSVTWAWIVVIALVPYVGFFLYLILGFSGRKHRTFVKKCREGERILDEIQKIYSPMPPEDAVKGLWDTCEDPKMERFFDLVKMNYTLGNHGLSTNNHLEIYNEGKAKYNSLLQDIKGAKRYVHMQYFILRNGELGRTILRALSVKAAEGVEVKIFVDGFGSIMLSSKFFKPLRDAGGDWAMFFGPMQIRINYHNHRKLCVIDGEIGYVGGMNIGDEYVGKKKRFGFWRDTHVRITGDAVLDLEARFICDWNFCSKNKITDYARYLPKSIDQGAPGVPMQVVSSGPDTRWPSIHYAYNRMVYDAAESVYIVTPYFVPDDSLLESLRTAALSGVDVKIIIPGIPDHFFVFWASLSYIGELLAAGAKCYKYTNGFIHAKVMIVDGVAASVGTANMDIRSLKLNCEVNTFIYDKTTAAALQTQFFQDLNHSEEITLQWYNARPRRVIVRESIARLLSPLM